MHPSSPHKSAKEEVFAAERKIIQDKRLHYHPEDLDGPSFGLALSGGGVRSATVNLGVLEVLNASGLLARADYLSSVSGGGYIAGYVHANLHKDRHEAYAKMFSPDSIERLQASGYYLTPGRGLSKLWSRIRFAGALTASFLMNWIWVLALAGVLIFGLQYLFYLLPGTFWYHKVFSGMLVVTLGGLAWHFFGHGLRHFRLWNSDLINGFEGVCLLLLVLWGTLYLSGQVPFPNFPAVFEWLGLPPPPPAVSALIPVGSGGRGLLLSLIILIFIGFFANPNVLSLHRFYRDRLRKAYLLAAGSGDQGLKLCDLVPDTGYWGPYPLINTCMNLFKSTDKTSKNSKTSCSRLTGYTKNSDYFLLSPRYCGSRLTGYAPTKSPSFNYETLATAVAVSGGAVNPHMGKQSSPLAAFFLTLLNLRLGYWAMNTQASWFRFLTWWPYYHILELLSLNDNNRWRVNLSDGGHIENLGVYELLRRGSQLIIAVDATADSGYAFSDLKNLVIRARNELGLVLDFQPAPETCIRPLPSQGFSQSHFVTATITDLPDKEPGERLYPSPGLLIYLKASLRARATWKSDDSPSYLYKTYHPAFPHESTADQFFDPDQWDAYYQLGRLMAANLLGVEIEKSGLKPGTRRFDNLKDLFQKLSPAPGSPEQRPFKVSATPPPAEKKEN